MGMRVREARFSCNTTDFPENVQDRILAVMISSVPVGTMFGRGKRRLEYMIHGILVAEQRDDQVDSDLKRLLSRNLPLNPGLSSPAVFERLSPMNDFGAQIGLEGYSCDMVYQVTARTHEVAKEVELLGLLSSAEIRYLKGLGERLVPEKIAAA